MKKLILILSVIFLLSCNRSDENVYEEQFIEHTLEIFENLKKHYPKEDIIVSFSKHDSLSFEQTDSIAYQPTDAIIFQQTDSIIHQQTDSIAYQQPNPIIDQQIDSINYQTAIFRLIGKTRELIQLENYVGKKLSKITYHSKSGCEREIKGCLDKGKDALISNGACEDGTNKNSSWCIRCIEND